MNPWDQHLVCTFLSITSREQRDYVRNNAVKASKFMRTHGPFMPAVLGPEEMEYTSRPEVLKELTKRMENLD